MIHEKATPSFDKVGHLQPAQSPSGKQSARDPEASTKVKPYNPIRVLTVGSPHNESAAYSAISATLLSNTISACHPLDLAICSQSEARSWRNLGPLQYVTSTEILKAWERDLTILCQRYRDGVYVPEKFELVLKGMLPAVDELEEARNKLSSLLEEKKKGRGGVMVDLEEVYQAVERRCILLEAAFQGLKKGFAIRNSTLGLSLC
jgi:hypothetical protein